MDWSRAIDRNREALGVVLAAIFALVGGRDGAGPVARRLRNAALLLLRPAESALRRLIVIAAQGVAARPRPPRAWAPERLAAAGGSGGGSRVSAFPLFDRPKRFGPAFRQAPPLGVPRIRTFWGPPLASSPIVVTAPAPARPDADAPADVARLRLRLRTFEFALADLPRQARRLARWRAKQAMGTHQSARGLRRSPLRLGRPPGWRLRPGREVDVVLRECHAFALDALAADTS
jgi:hypothetical protein